MSQSKINHNHSSDNARNQNIEYKSSWRDEYLKWICGFANANGGSIFIGKDDNGNVVGVTDAPAGG